MGILAGGDMGIRLTGISTPIGGVEWEYINDTKKAEHAAPYTILPDQKNPSFHQFKHWGQTPLTT